MKSDKTRPATDRQHKQAKYLGYKLPEGATVHDANKIFDEWSATVIKVGDKVQFSPIIGGEFEPKVYLVTHIGIIGFTMVAWLEGKSGCVSIKALRKVQP